MEKELKICIVGGIRAGKSTAADYLEKKYFTTPFALGDKLTDGFHIEYPHIPRNPKPRKGYQLYGQFKRYLHGADFWTDICFEDIERIRKVATNYNTTGSEAAFSPMITDARQPNEFDRCREEGYILIKVWAPLELRIKRATEAGDAFEVDDFFHETEQYIEDTVADYVIVNETSTEDMYAQIDEIIADIGRKSLCS